MDPAEFACMGTYFRQAGYETAYFGKWHLCFAQKDINAHGFDMPRSPAGQGRTKTPRLPPGRPGSSRRNTTSLSCWWPVS